MTYGEKDDKSFGSEAWEGIVDATLQYGVEGYYQESPPESDYLEKINEYLQQDCSLIVSYNVASMDDMQAAAEANPDQNFAFIEGSFDTVIPNLRVFTTKVSQAAYLAGYLAAGMTKTGKVGTYGGALLPTVTEFMDGFYWGVQKYNEVHGTAIEVLGWNPTTQTGSFTGDFVSMENARNAVEQLMDMGADIIMPVMGSIGSVTMEVMRERRTGLVIGVDTDWSYYYPEYTELILASVTKNVRKFVLETIAFNVNRTFTGGIFMGDLINGGVNLTIGSTWLGKLPQDLREELDSQLIAVITDGIPTLP